jgi:glycosyltransferase involved in cell wall biosynthesis
VRLFLVSQFYPPDLAPTGTYLHDLARTLVERGHEVHVVCSRGSYAGADTRPRREQMDGVLVHRLAALGRGKGSLVRRIADSCSFLTQLALRLALGSPRPDAVLSLTSPPYAGFVAKLGARLRGARHAHWLMDLYPDVLAAHGWLRRGSMAFSMLAYLTRKQLEGSSLTLTLGPEMARKVEPYGTAEWVPLWRLAEVSPCPASDGPALRQERGWRPEELVLMYSGNMGRGHRFVEFLEAAARLGPAGPRWAFVGGGARRSEIEAFVEQHPSLPVDLHPYVPRARLSESLCSADVHLASLEARWQGLMVPSKIQAIFAVGRPVIFVGKRENELARWTSESGGGWVVDEGDVGGLLHAIDEARDPAERARRGQAALGYARERFDRERNLKRVADLVERLGAP